MKVKIAVRLHREYEIRIGSLLAMTHPLGELKACVNQHIEHFATFEHDDETVPIPDDVREALDNLHHQLINVESFIKTYEILLKNHKDELEKAELK